MRPDTLGAATMGARKMPLAIDVGPKANAAHRTFPPRCCLGHSVAAEAYSIELVRAKKSKRSEVRRLGPIKREPLSSMLHGQRKHRHLTRQSVPQYRLWRARFDARSR